MEALKLEESEELSTALTELRQINFNQIDEESINGKRQKQARFLALLSESISSMGGRDNPLTGGRQDILNTFSELLARLAIVLDEDEAGDVFGNSIFALHNIPSGSDSLLRELQLSIKDINGSLKGEGYVEIRTELLEWVNRIITDVSKSKIPLN